MIILTDCLADYSDEGSNAVAANLVRQLKSSLPDTTIITFNQKGHMSDLHLKLNPLFLNRPLLSLLRRKQENVLYIPFSSNTRGAVLRTFLLSKLSKSEICTLFTLRRPMDRFTQMLLRSSGARVLCLSEDSWKFYRSIIGSRASYLKTGVDTLRFSPVDAEEKSALRQKIGIAPDQKVLLHVGHLKEGRNIRQLLNVDERYHILLVVSTQTKNERSLPLRKALEARPNTTIIDYYVPEIQQLYQMADVYFFPVQEPENCIDVPLSVLEAAACNLPVVTTPYGELQQFEEKEGFYFLNSFEPESLNPLLDLASTAARGIRSMVLPYDWSNAPAYIRHTKPTKVLHLLVSGGIGGIEVLMKHYAADSSLENHFAFLWDGGPVAEQMQRRGFPVYILDIKKDGSLRTLQRIARLFKLERFDAVVSHHRAPFLKLILLWLKANFPDVRTFAYAHSNARDICESSREKGLLLRIFIHKLAYLTADGVIAISRSVKDSLINYLSIPSGKIRVIYNGISIPAEFPLRSAPGARLLYAGRLVPEKGVQITLRALHLLEDDLPFTFYIAGDGPYRETLVQLTSELGLEKQVRFLGSQQDISRLLRQADFFVHMPCWEEGFGLSVIEAMAAGCVCICAASGAMPEIITDGTDGFLVKKDDPADLAGTLSRVIRQNIQHGFTQLRRRAAARAAEFSSVRFSHALDAYIVEEQKASSDMPKLVLPLPNSLFRIGLLLTMFKTLTSVSGIVPWCDWADDLLSVLAAGCFCISLLRKNYTLKRMTLYGAVALLSLVSAQKSGMLTMVLTVLTCLSFYREDFDRSIRFLLFWEGLYVLFHVGASMLLTCLGDPASTVISGNTRYHFGFSHPNVFSVLLINLLSMWAWLHYDRLKAGNLFAIFAIAAVFCCFTGTRSALCAAAVLVFLLAIRRHEKLLRFGGAVCVTIMALAEYFLWSAFLDGNNLAQTVNSALSGRINLAAYALEHFDFSWIGQDLQNISIVWDEFWQISSFTFDDIYSYLAVNHGVLWLVLVCVLLFRVARKGSAKSSIFLILWALYGTTETHVVNPYLFFPILLVMEEKP